jgi:hypothetical protein
VSDDFLDALLPDDRAWLRAHGWTEPPPRPHWVDGDLVVECPACGEQVPVEYTELMTFASTEPVGYVTDEVGALRRHEPNCAARHGTVTG